MTSPIDTIRQALLLNYLPTAPVLAALTEVEHQLAARGFSLDEMQQVREAGRAAETALAEAKRENEEWNALYGRLDTQRRQEVEAAERRANDLTVERDTFKQVAKHHAGRAIALADALREAQAVLIEISSKPYRAEEATAAYFARAALDRQEQT